MDVIQGASLINMHINVINQTLAISALVAVFLAVGGLIIGSVLLVYETKITVRLMKNRIRKLIQNHES